MHRAEGGIVGDPWEQLALQQLNKEAKKYLSGVFKL